MRTLWTIGVCVAVMVAAARLQGEWDIYARAAIGMGVFVGVCAAVFSFIEWAKRRNG